MVGLVMSFYWKPKVTSVWRKIDDHPWCVITRPTAGPVHLHARILENCYFFYKVCSWYTCKWWYRSLKHSFEKSCREKKKLNKTSMRGDQERSKMTLVRISGLVFTQTGRGAEWMLPPPAVVSLPERSSFYQASNWLIRLQLELYRHLLAWLWFKRHLWSFWAEGDFSCQMMLAEILSREKWAGSPFTSWFTCGLDSSLSRQGQQLPSLPTAQSKEVSKYEWLVMNDDEKDKHRLVVLSTELPSIYACKVSFMFSSLTV